MLKIEMVRLEKYFNVMIIRVANIHHSHVVFFKFSTAIFKSSDSLHLDCIKLNWYVCVCRSFICVCHWRVSICSYLPDKKV